MSCRNTFTAFALIAASMQGACVANPAPNPCSIDGAKHFSATATENEICEAFRRDFYAAMGGAEDARIYSIALTVSADGTISAQISDNGAASGRTIPQVAVDVMDRDLDYRDVTRLAEAAAKVVKTGQTGD